ncbi:MAG: tetratricopeptide repeat protein [Archangium sp.]|nr:tetratricopeptide repeat protein [Archangium sp.]MDP3574608.1 tetratricopeptide repeat protein [Archangium sp.]
MTQDERVQLETQVERHVRRGELSEARALLERLCSAFPEDALLADRLVQLEQGLDPAERRRVAMSRIEPTGKHKTPMHEAEALAAGGKYKEAILIYRQLLEARPDWELVKERLAELFQLAQVAAPNRGGLNHEGTLEHLLDRITTRKRG